MSGNINQAHLGAKVTLVAKYWDSVEIDFVESPLGARTCKVYFFLMYFINYAITVVPPLLPSTLHPPPTHIPPL